MTHIYTYLFEIKLRAPARLKFDVAASMGLVVSADLVGLPTAHYRAARA